MVANKEVMKLCREAKQAAQELRTISSSKIDKALKNMAEALVKNQKSILVENAKDIKNARKKKLSPALIDRLMLNKSRIESMSKSLKEVAGMMSPLGEIIEMYTRPNGLKIGKMRIAIGVVLIIYESRPNVTSDCVGLCLKSGNVIILRGGSEAFNSNRAIFNTLKGILDKMGFPKGAINMVMTKDRKILNQLFEQNEFIDLCIPRGGESLIRNVTQNSRIPIIKHYKGVCHTYVDKEASLDMAIEICYNA